MKLTDYLAIAGVSHVLRYPPDINCPGKAENTNMNGRGVRPVSVAAPVSPVAEKADPADVDVYPFWQINVNVPERRKNGHCGLPVVDRDVTQVEVEIPETARGEGSPA